MGIEARGWAGGRVLLVCSMIHPLASLDAVFTEIPLPNSPQTLIVTISVVIEMVEPDAFGDGFGLPRVDIWSDDPFRKQNHLCRVCGSSRDAMRGGHRPWAHTADAIP